MEELATVELSEKIQIKINNFSVNYTHLHSAEQTIKVIFNNNSPYKFITEKKQPCIIDVGSGVGISTLYFKSLYPQAKLLCFEPDPNAFSCLRENIIENHLEDIQLFRRAITANDGMLSLFGQSFSHLADNRSNSTIEVWGCQCKENDVIQVEADKLSNYISDTVDFLKLDAAGCEEQILVELEAEGKLPLIREMAVEMYQATRIKPFNSLPRIFSLLKQNDFEVTVTEKDSSFLVSDDNTRQWAKKIKPHLFTIRALRLDNDSASH